MNKPMISVVMPVYNGEKYLHEAIDSILSQTYTNFEFIILNDGSTDKTEEIVLSFTDTRIIYVKNETNLQIVKTLNRGIELAQGKYIARMDADDISLPQRFEEQVEFMEEHGNIDICGTWFETFGAKAYIQKLPTHHDGIKACLLFYTPIAHPTVMMKKSIFNNYSYSDDFPNAEDFALWTNLIDSFKFKNLPEALLLYRLHSDQTGVKSSDVQNHSTSRALSLFLKKLDTDFSSEYPSSYKAYMMSEYFTFDETEKWLQKLLSINAVKKYFDGPSLKNCVFEIWKIKAFSQPKNNLNIWTRFYKSSLYISDKLSFAEHLKFWIKCVSSYSSVRKNTRIKK